MTKLTEFAPGLWQVEQHHQSWGLHIRVRMVVVLLEDGGLWVHSPVELDNELVAQLNALGAVQHIVAPCRGHSRWAASAKSVFPNAALWGPPGMKAHMPAIPWDKEMSETDTWKPQLETHFLKGTPKNSEVVFIHDSSRTLICTDWVLNVNEEPSALTRWLYRSIGVWRELGPASIWRKRTTDPDSARSSYEAVLDAGFDKVLMAHGDPIMSEGVQKVRAAMGWVLKRH